MIELIAAIPLPDTVTKAVQVLPARHVIEQNPADLPAFANQLEPTGHGGRQENQRSGRNGLLTLVGEQRPPSS